MIQIMSDSLVGKKVRLWREPDEYAKKYESKFRYSNRFVYPESVICEIMEVVFKDTVNYTMKLIISDDGSYGVLNCRISMDLQIVG